MLREGSASQSYILRVESLLTPADALSRTIDAVSLLLLVTACA